MPTFTAIEILLAQFHCWESRSRLSSDLMDSDRRRAVGDYSASTVISTLCPSGSLRKAE
jgi:hypothetical protein